jgi:hypothetical protein
VIVPAGHEGAWMNFHRNIFGSMSSSSSFISSSSSPSSTSSPPSSGRRITGVRRQLESGGTHGADRGGRGRQLEHGTGQNEAVRDVGRRSIPSEAGKRRKVPSRYLGEPTGQAFERLVCD